jgi:SSS family solute:Na+ symporter
MGLQTLDWITLSLYFALIMGVAWWVIRKRKDTAADYFLAGRNLGWWLVGASIFASNIGSEHLVGLAGTGATDGVAMAHYELHAWCLLVLAWVFVPFYARSLVFTMPEFLERRFSSHSRFGLSIVSLVTFVVSKMAVGIFAGGVVFATLLPEVHLHLGGLEVKSFWVGSVLVIVVTGLYTMLGGLRAVAYNDAIQVVILVLGSAVLTIYGLVMLGGWDELRAICGSDMFNLWSRFPRTGDLGAGDGKSAASQVVKQAWYFNGYYPLAGHALPCAHYRPMVLVHDQYIVQRALGAPDERTARRGIFTGILKLLPVYLFIIPGMIAFALAKSGKVPGLEVMVSPDGRAIPHEAQAAFPLLVKYMLPAGLRGLVVAGLLSALMSSLAGVFNAASTLITVDLYSKWKTRATQHQIVRFGRLATAAMVFVALMWIPVIQGGRWLYNYLQAVQSYLAPPIFVVFFFGVFWKRLNSKGCLWALIVGFSLGLFRMAVDTPVALGLFGYADAAGTIANGYREGSFLWVVNNIFFQYFSVLITVVSILVMIVVSFLTREPDYEKIKSLTFGTATEEDRRRTRASWDWRDLLGSAIVLAFILAAYLYFRG